MEVSLEPVGPWSMTFGPQIATELTNGHSSLVALNSCENTGVRITPCASAAALQDPTSAVGCKRLLAAVGLKFTVQRLDYLLKNERQWC